MELQEHADCQVLENGFQRKIWHTEEGMCSSQIHSENESHIIVLKLL